MGKHFFINLLIIICAIILLPQHVFAQLYPDFEQANRPRKKKPQKEIPRFPPQFHARDTTQAVRDSIAKIKGTTMQNGVVKVVPKAAPPPQRTDSTVRIVSRKEDAMGNITIEQETIVGKRKTRQTIIIGGQALNKPFNPDTINKDSITIQIVKKSYKMFVYHKHRFLTAYKCVFGPPYLEQKQREGDRRTPEGWFKILEVRPHKEWNTFMLIDYPNEESKRCNRQKCHNRRCCGHSWSVVRGR
jgi:L,D-transpeptidase catalytic domain